MGVIAAIDSTSVSAEPGAEASTSIRVRNTGMVVDQVLLDVLGEARPWSTVEPDQLNLLPGTDGLARVVFRPPRRFDNSGCIGAGRRTAATELVIEFRFVSVRARTAGLTCHASP